MVPFGGRRTEQIQGYEAMHVIRNGTNWTISIFQDGNNQVAAPITFYWIPLGTAPNGQTFERIGDAEAPKLHMSKRVPVDKLALIPKLIDLIDSLLAQPEDSGEGER